MRKNVTTINDGDNDSSIDDHELEPRSKQQQKREAEAVQAVGAELVNLTATQLNEVFEKLDLPDNLREALLACRTIKSHGAHRRQLQYIGKLMRGIEIASVKQLLAEFKRGRQMAAAEQHRIEHWRDRLLNEGDTALNELLKNYPGMKAAQVQKLITMAKRESVQNQPPRAARQLFKYLRELMQVIN